MISMRGFLLISKAISDKTRVRILKLLEYRELCVCQLMAVLEMGQSTVSKHLGILKNAGLIEDRKDRTWSFYSLSKKGINTKFFSLLSFALEDDTLVLKDGKKLKEVIKKDIKNLCSTGRKK